LSDEFGTSRLDEAHSTPARRPTRKNAQAAKTATNSMVRRSC